MENRMDNRLGWVISIVLHGLLIFGFYLYSLELKPFDLDFTPVTFAAMSEVDYGGGSKSPKWGGATPKVELPKRPMLEETSPLLKVPDSDRQPVIAQSEAGKPDLSDLESTRPGHRVPMQSAAAQDRERAPLKPMPLSDSALYGKRTDVLAEQIASQESFTIEWDGPARVKTAGSLPKFPAGVNKEATVRLSFTAAPDGSVVSVAPLTKGEPEFERVSMLALRSWRFNKLDASMAQKNQKGVITFRFELE